MKVAIHQPQFLPYPGFFNKICNVDAWVVMDDAQYDKRYTNRNQILSPGGPIWLTVPIDKTKKFSQNREVSINNEIPWREEHWKKISHSYRNAKWFSEYGPYFEGLYGRDHQMLTELDVETTRKVMEWLGMGARVILESSLGISSKSTQRLIDVCKAVGADTYVSGMGGRDYMDVTMFPKNGLGLEFQDYRPSPYPQRFGATFVPNLSIIDLLFNMGPESRNVVAGEPKEEEGAVPRVTSL